MTNVKRDFIPLHKECGRVRAGVRPAPPPPRPLRGPYRDEQYNTAM